MRARDYDADENTLRPKAARLEDTADSRRLQAAAAGRSDVLDAPGMLRLQRAVGNAGVGALVEEERSPVHDVVASGNGSSLAPDVRAEMEARLGHDFGDVRVHTDAQAHESARVVNAQAYTVGSNVVFQRDKYDPTSDEGKTMLAHELTHVAQQRSGPVDGTPAGGGIKVSDPSDRFEREAAATAEQAMSTPLRAAPAAAGGGSSSVQRQEAPEEEKEEEVQTFVQREAAAEEEEEEPVQGAFLQRQEASEEEETDEASG